MLRPADRPAGWQTRAGRRQGGHGPQPGGTPTGLAPVSSTKSPPRQGLDTAPAERVNVEGKRGCLSTPPHSPIGGTPARMRAAAQPGPLDKGRHWRESE